MELTYLWLYGEGGVEQLIFFCIMVFGVFFEKHLATSSQEILTQARSVRINFSSVTTIFTPNVNIVTQYVSLNHTFTWAESWKVAKEGKKKTCDKWRLGLAERATTQRRCWQLPHESTRPGSVCQQRCDAQMFPSIIKAVTCFISFRSKLRETHTDRVAHIFEPCQDVSLEKPYASSQPAFLLSVQIYTHCPYNWGKC